VRNADERASIVPLQRLANRNVTHEGPLAAASLSSESLDRIFSSCASLLSGYLRTFCPKIDSTRQRKLLARSTVDVPFAVRDKGLHAHPK